MQYISHAEFDARVRTAAQDIWQSRQDDVSDDEDDGPDQAQADWDAAEYTVHLELQMQEVGVRD